MSKGNTILDGEHTLNKRSHNIAAWRGSISTTEEGVSVDHHESKGIYLEALCCNAHLNRVESKKKRNRKGLTVMSPKCFTLEEDE